MTAFDTLGTRGPLLVLAHALGLDRHVFDAAATDLAADHRVLRYDARSHGASATVAGPFTIDDLATDAAAFIAAQCGGAPVWFAGVSMGGMVAQVLAADPPPGLRGVVVANSAAHYADRSGWDSRIAAVQQHGLAAIADGALARWLTPGFVATPHGAAVAAQLRATLLASDPAGYVEACRAVAAIDLRAANAQARVPVLVLDGRFDEATPPACSDAIAAALPQADRVTLDAAHISPAERPAEFAAAVRGFIARHAAAPTTAAPPAA